MPERHELSSRHFSSSKVLEINAQYSKCVDINEEWYKSTSLEAQKWYQFYAQRLIELPRCFDTAESYSLIIGAIEWCIKNIFNADFLVAMVSPLIVAASDYSFKTQMLHKITCPASGVGPKLVDIIQNLIFARLIHAPLVLQVMPQYIYHSSPDFKELSIVVDDGMMTKQEERDKSIQLVNLSFA